jgi:hypothetical protein
MLLPLFFSLLSHTPNIRTLPHSHLRIPLSSPAMAELSAQSIYEARPLSREGRFVRVITIRLSTAPDESEAVACDFHLLDLDNRSLCDFKSGLPLSEREQVQYTALSYTWGDATPLHTIVVNDQTLQVRHNLWNFLQTARKSGLKEYLWIDALCIDQEQLQERNHQVWMMGATYSMAERVIVWMGTASKNVDGAMKELEKSPLSAWQPDAFTRHRKGLMELYKMAYWSRAWIVQEYVLAKTIAIWFETLQIDEARLDAVAGGETFGDWRSPASRVIEARQRRIARRKFVSADWEAEVAELADDTTVLGLLTLFHLDLYCEDPRDRVYSLLSLLDPAERARLAITPDYSVSTLGLAACVVCAFRSSRRTHKALIIQALVHMLKLTAPKKESYSTSGK